ncbi:hypothetical protein DEJ25_09715 [Curtobacterium sp. MCPF17_011]|nr:hypothetical protein DEJ25_09715 [Curtobacterium sp. MCPF17_011]
MRFDELTDTSWRIFTAALMWSNENGTDGFIPTRYLKMLHPDGEKQEAIDDLEALKFWERQEDGYLLRDWAGALGQSTSTEVDTYKANARERQRRWRERERQKTAKRVGFNNSESDVTRYETSDVTQNVGTGTGTGTGTGEGQAQDNEGDWFVDNETGEITDPAPSVPAPSVTTWDVTPIGQSLCRVPGCFVDVEGIRTGVCPSQDDAHNNYRAQPD